MSEDSLDTGLVNIIGGPINKIIRTPNRLEKKRILKGHDDSIRKTRLIGGDCQEDNLQPPSIILEREGEQITKIIVKCTCGRHAELVCEDEEDKNELVIDE